MSRPLRAFLLLFGVCVPAIAGAQSAPGARPCAPARVDHIPIAVRSLDDARQRYANLGFRLKEGRLHTNGLQNVFAKFESGGYLELISPTRGATDARAKVYVGRLAQRERGGALALRVDSLRRVSGVLEREGFPGGVDAGHAFVTRSFDDPSYGWLFLIEYLLPLRDPPELLEHPNTAVGIEAIWTTSGAYSALASLSTILCTAGVRIGEEDGEGLAVTGVTLRVRSVRRAREVLRSHGIQLPILSDGRGRFLSVPAVQAHGLRIELLEPHRS